MPPPPNEPPRVRLGELLVQAGALTADRLAEALELQRASQREGAPRTRLGQVLVDRGFIDETMLTQVLGRQLAVPWVSLYHVDFSRQLLNLVPREVAESYGIIPVYVRHVRGQGDTLYVATDDPTSTEGLQRVGVFAGLPVRPMIASATDIRAAIRVYYGPPPAAAVPTAVVVAPAPAREAVEPPPTVAARPPIAPEGEPKRARPESSPPPTRQEGPRRDSGSSPKAADAPAAAAPPVAAQVVAAPAIDASPVSPPATKPSRPSANAAGIAALTSMAGGTPAPPRAASDEGPEIEATPISIPPRKNQRRSIALTFLDGTTISLPAPRKVKGREEPERPSAEPVPPSGAENEDQLTARDLVAALRAVSHGADASEILGENPRWEALFAALLSLMLKKHLVADWEFVDEFRKI